MGQIVNNHFHFTITFKADLRHTALGTTFAIGGFLVGTKLALIIDKYKALNRSRIQQRRSNYRFYKSKTT